MRIDSPEFAAANQAAAKRPRLVVRHVFDVGSIYVTSSADMINVPGNALLGHLQNVSGVSQEVFPDEARSTIGNLSYSIVDIDEEFGAALRNQLQVELQDLRERDVELRLGYTDDYNDTQVLFTQQVRSASYENGAYRIGCEDIQRATRKDIFEPLVTTLRLSVSETDDVIPAQDTTGFQPVFHGPSYGDGPNSTVGYFRLDDEIIRYTGTTADSFTGCARGVFNTVPAPHEVEAGAEDDRQPEVTEFIYLELPGPKLDYAILTGVLVGDAATLPPHWSLGVPTNKVALSQFQAIGPDLWDTTDDDATIPLRFAGLEKTDGKQFLEEQVRQPLGVYAPVLSDGSLGLRRMNHILDDAPYVLTLDEDSFIQVGALEHDYQSLLNVFSIDWNWDPIAERFTRRRVIVDQGSIDVHGEADTKTLEWEGIHGSRHTDAVLRKRSDSIRDRYAAPPLRMSGELLHSYNALEVGDVVRVNLQNVRDYTGPVGALDRSFEIQRIAVDQVAGRVSVNLFGSTGRAGVLPPDTGTALPDGWYSSQGTELSTVATIVGGVVQPGTYNLTGNADLNAAGAIYYHLGDLELADGATLTLNDNVQLRIRGFITGNGDLDLAGRGIPGATDDGVPANVNAGTQGFVGNTRGWDGLRYEGFGDVFVPREAALTTGLHSAFPLLELSVENGALVGLPTDLRGTSGGIGGRILNQDGSILANGGAGGAGGAGLAVICRGAAFGVSGSINTSGGDSALGAQVSVNGRDYRAGSGAPGGPGSVLFVIDGSNPSLPDVLGSLTGSHGSMPNAGEEPAPFVLNWVRWFGDGLRAGYNNALVQNMTASVLRIQRLAGEQTPTEDIAVPAPANFAVATNGSASAHVLTNTPPPPGVITEYLASITDNRNDAIVVGSSTVGRFDHVPDPDTETFYWSRNRNFALARVSGFTPSTAVTTVIGEALSAPADGGSANGLIINGGFENVRLTPWLGFAQLGATNPRTGEYHGVLPFSGTIQTQAFTNRFPATEGDRFRVSGWFARDETNLPSGSIALAITFYDSGGAELSAGLDLVSQSVAGYQLARVEADAPANTVEAGVSVDQFSGAGGRWFFDDIWALLIRRDISLSPNGLPPNIEQLDSDNIAAEVGIRVASDGNIYFRTGDGSTYINPAQWIGNGQNSDYDCVLESTDAAALTVGTANQWLQCNENRDFEVRRDTTNGTSLVVGRLKIRRRSDNVVFDSTPVRLEAVIA